MHAQPVTLDDAALDAILRNVAAVMAEPAPEPEHPIPHRTEVAIDILRAAALALEAAAGLIHLRAGRGQPGTLTPFETMTLDSQLANAAVAAKFLRSNS